MSFGTQVYTLNELKASNPDQGIVKEGPLRVWMGVGWSESPFRCACFVSIVQHKSFPQCCFSPSKDPLPIFIEFSCVVKEMSAIEG